MITEARRFYVNEQAFVAEYRGLSTDEKPTRHSSQGMKCVNGSTFKEIDTGDTYMYDQENHIWVKI